MSEKIVENALTVEQKQELEPVQNQPRPVMCEEDRFLAYTAIEQKSLEIMAEMLDYYSRIPSGDPSTDKFKMRLITSFVNTTHSCRDELLKKYAIDKTTGKHDDNNKLTIEFVEVKNGV